MATDGQKLSSWTSEEECERERVIVLDDVVCVFCYGVGEVFETV